ncbi:hypothetical protein C8Q79DRAFT_1006563 [Trametes meyenii]|nr:hypothetical protein C8Q79DRAFT_1006563 [Trametes meyenii]
MSPVPLFNINDNDEADQSIQLRKVLSGETPEYVATHPGHSQYSRDGGGVSACGVAALNCARIVLGLHAAGVESASIVQELMKRRMLEGVLKPCLSWANSSHLAVEEIHKAPIFEKTLKLVRQEYGQASYGFLKRLIDSTAQCAKERGVPCCTIITRPPEIIACFSIPDVPNDLFVIFDSHPRPEKHPEGAAFIFQHTVNATADYLTRLLRYDEHLLREAGVQWQAQLLAYCSGDIFVAADTALTGDQWAETTLDASLQALNLRAKVHELESRVQELEGEKRSLQGEVTQLEHNLLRMDDTLRRERVKFEQYRKGRKASESSASSSRYSQNGYSLWRPSWASLNPWGSDVATSNARGDGDDLGRSPQRRNEGVVNADDTALAIQRSYDQENSRRKGKSPALQHVDPIDIPTDSPADVSVVDIDIPDDMQDVNSGTVPEIDPLALAMQHEFDEENRQLEEQLKYLQKIQPKFFHCGICFDEFQEDNVARVAPCEHAYCRDCLTGYATSKIEEHRYPILCPQCTADKTRSEVPGEIDDEAVQKLGLTDKQYGIYVDMQMSKFSTMIDCRKCQQTLWVDRDEYQESKVITCPLQGCGYVWCKLCSQPVDNTVPEHSCDGTNELDHLMKEQGWKHCPGCKTPAEKIMGCNHIACGAPGCNTHFCYLCGELIVRSALPQEINTAKMNHYARCTLF